MVGYRGNVLIRVSEVNHALVGYMSNVLFRGRTTPWLATGALSGSGVNQALVGYRGNIVFGGQPGPGGLQGLCPVQGFRGHLEQCPLQGSRSQSGPGGLQGLCPIQKTRGPMPQPLSLIHI